MTWKSLKTPQFKKVPHNSIVYAKFRQTVSRYSLPPGKWIDLDAVERANRRFLLEHAAQVGPIFKATSRGACWICIVGITQSRKLLKEHGKYLQPTTLELKSLFPQGFLRQMQDAEHQRYRKSLVQAMQAAHIVTASSRKIWEQISDAELEYYRVTQHQSPNSPEPFIRTLDNIATGMLMHMFFGVNPDSEEYQTLMQYYHQLGPFGLVWNIGQQQQQAFSDIRHYLLHRVADQQQPDGILGHLHHSNELDDTMLGNLIYMLEMGRYDLYSLFRWLSKYAANDTDLAQRIALEAQQKEEPTPSLVDAFVQETLRMDQSERLIRIAQRDIIFDGYLIPKYATVRLCLWEAHKSSDIFTNPFDFNPERFMQQGYTADEYAPFGLDHHRCPFSDSVVAMSKAFIKVLSCHYVVSPIKDGLPVRGAYHWEPASRFSVELKKNN